MKVLVTGGSGFVGSEVIPHLVAEGHEVVALARSGASQEKVRALGAQPVSGELTDRAALEQAARECDAVVHMAAAFDMWGDDAWFYQTNVQGTENLLAAAQAAGVSRFVYMSAASVIAGGVPASMVDERYTPPRSPDDAYSSSKLAAETRVLRANRPGFATMALRPPLIWGSGHYMIEEVRRAAARGGWMWIGGGAHRLSTVHVRNLCQAVSAALARGQGGEVYFVTDGEAWPVRRFITAWMAQHGIRLPGRSIPRPMAMRMAGGMARIWRALRLRSAPPITPSMVYMLGVELSVSDRKAREQLGYAPVISIEDGLAGRAGGAAAVSRTA
jgi:nucleoside-diphosphate-sugar epimerase